MGERIPDDIMKAAEEALDMLLCNCPEAGDVRRESILDIARAILAERERCAKIVEAEFQNNWPDYRCIVRAIRGES